MTLLLAGAGAWIALLTLFCCVLAVASRADRELERSRPPARGPVRARLRVLPGGAQDSSAVSSSGNRTALASRSSRRPL
jgi:hypothetical protein